MMAEGLSAIPAARAISENRYFDKKSVTSAVAGSFVSIGSFKRSRNLGPSLTFCSLSAA
jgi:hypothetical protein